jgi:hypothetical protein
MTYARDAVGYDKVATHVVLLDLRQMHVEQLLAAHLTGP